MDFDDCKCSFEVCVKGAPLCKKLTEFKKLFFSLVGPNLIIKKFHLKLKFKNLKIRF